MPKSQLGKINGLENGFNANGVRFAEVEENQLQRDFEILSVISRLEDRAEEMRQILFQRVRSRQVFVINGSRSYLALKSGNG